MPPSRHPPQALDRILHPLPDLRAPWVLPRQDRVQIHAGRRAEYVRRQAPLLRQLDVRRCRAVERATTATIAATGGPAGRRMRRRRRRVHEALRLDRASAVDELGNAERTLPRVRLLPARERGDLSDRESRRVLAAHDAHHRQRAARLLLVWVLLMLLRAGGALDVGAVRGPEFTVYGEEARGLEPCGRCEDVEPERRLDDELLRVGAPQDSLCGAPARVQHVPDPVSRDGEELLPCTASAAEEEGRDDE